MRNKCLQDGAMDHRTDIVPAPPIGQTVARVRLRKGLTQEAVAQRLEDLGWSRPTNLIVYKIENGIRKVDTHELVLLAHALKCQLEELIKKPAKRSASKRVVTKASGKRKAPAKRSVGNRVAAKARRKAKA